MNNKELKDTTDEEFEVRFKAVMADLGIEHAEKMTFDQAAQVTAKLFNVSKEAAQLKLITDMADGRLSYHTGHEATKTVN